MMSYEELSNKGLALDNLGKTDEAITCYDKALEINPRYVEAWNNKGHVLAKLGKTDEALYAFERFIEVAPAHLAGYIEQVKGFIHQA